MKNSSGQRLLAIVAASTLSTVALGFVQPENRSKTALVRHAAHGERIVRPETAIQPMRIAPFTNRLAGAEIRWDSLSGAARLVTGSNLGAVNVKAPEGGTDFVQTALNFVDQNSDLFGVSSSDLTIKAGSLLIDKDVQFVSFNVSRDGIPVVDAGIQFRFKQGTLVQVANTSFSEAKGDARPLIPSLGPVVERAFASASIDAGQDIYRVVPAKSGYELVRARRFQVKTLSGESLTVDTDAGTGLIFESRDNHHYMDGEVNAQLYNRYYNDPLITAPVPNADIANAGSAVRSDLTGRFVAADDSTPKVQGLKGQYVSIVDKTDPEISRDGAKIRDLWTISLDKRSTGNPYEARDVAVNMAYYHTDLIIQYAKQFIQPEWFNAPLTANVNLRSNCNAHWDGSTINFYSAGRDCANTGLISDVMYHEWGHGLDANTGGIDDGAFSEGYGDIMSLIITKSPILGIGFRTNDGSPVRDLEPNAHYPEDKGEVHAEGLIIGSTFWDLFVALRDRVGEAEAQALVAKYAFKVIYTATKYTDVYDALLVIDDNDANPANGTPNKCVINEAFELHGLAEKDAGCALAAVEQFSVDDSAGNNNGVIEPGESIKIRIVARNDGPNAIEGMTGLFSVAANDAVHVSNADVVFPMIASQSMESSTNTADLTVDSAAVCGSSFVGKVVLTAGPRQAAISKTFDVGRSVGTPDSFVGTGLPVSIPDNQTVYAPTEISGAQWAVDTKVREARLKFAVTHTYVGDLRIGLVAPDGRTTEVYRGNGDGRNIAFDQDVSSLVAGQLGTGTWKIYVTDTADRDVGTLDSFELVLTPQRVVCQ